VTYFVTPSLAVFEMM